MSARQELHSYVTRLERRLRRGTLSRGTAIVVGAALGVTIVLAGALSAFAFPDGSITGARLVLFVVLALAAVFGSALLAFWLSASPIATKRTSTEAAVAMSDLRRENILIIPYQTGTATWQSDCHSSSGRLGVMLTSLVGATSAGMSAFWSTADMADL